ncbi:MAG: ATP-binding protein [Longimicrobiales bacterium]
MTIAMAWSGGKDSMLALDRLIRAGHDVRFLLNLYDRASGRIRFHGVRRELIQRQAERIGLLPFQLAVSQDNFETVFLDGLARLRRAGATGIAFGNIHLADVRGWYEERTTAAGLAHIEPLWGARSEELVAELMSRGYRAMLTSVDVARAKREWLGRLLDPSLAKAIVASPGVDPAGEAGEYHTFVYDGPLLREPIDLVQGIVHDTANHAMIDLVESEADSGSRAHMQ